MCVLVTPITNRPTKRASRAVQARQQISGSSVMSLWIARTRARMRTNSEPCRSGPRHDPLRQPHGLLQLEHELEVLPPAVHDAAAGDVRDGAGRAETESHTRAQLERHQRAAYELG